MAPMAGPCTDQPRPKVGTAGVISSSASRAPYAARGPPERRPRESRRLAHRGASHPSGAGPTAPHAARGRRPRRHRRRCRRGAAHGQEPALRGRSGRRRAGTTAPRRRPRISWPGRSLTPRPWPGWRPARHLTKWRPSSRRSEPSPRPVWRCPRGEPRPSRVHLARARHLPERVLRGGGAVPHGEGHHHRLTGHLTAVGSVTPGASCGPSASVTPWPTRPEWAYGTAPRPVSASGSGLPSPPELPRSGQSSSRSH